MTKKEKIAKCDFILSLGTLLADNKEDVRNSVIESIAKTDAQFVYMHPIDNIDLKLYYTQFIKYEVGSEEGICSMLLDTFVKNSNQKIQKYIDELDLGYISAEASAGEEEFEQLFEISENSRQKCLIVGDDIIEHPRVDNIVKLLAIIDKYTDFEIIVLDDNLAMKINSCSDENLEEIEDLKSFDGTVVYKLVQENSVDELVCSQTFVNIAKVSNKDEIYIINSDNKIKKFIKVDKKLNGTIAILTLSNSDDRFTGYRYKQVKIQKVEEYEQHGYIDD